ncbi:hypothetical protein [Streptomyces sp. NRRL S-87]|uniref:hypothetical protein n=1 Tax=Streptomyces sp. NRRL S-87 TaxID=1463920 RepID=UPI0004C0E12D|nr:hypothetical protein [Streptomyces sp. NRRL S-87]
MPIPLDLLQATPWWVLAGLAFLAVVLGFVLRLARMALPTESEHRLRWWQILLTQRQESPAEGSEEGRGRAPAPTTGPDHRARPPGRERRPRPGAGERPQ